MLVNLGDGEKKVLTVFSCSTPLHQTIKPKKDINFKCVQVASDSKITATKQQTNTFFFFFLQWQMQSSVQLGRSSKLPLALLGPAPASPSPPSLLVSLSDQR